MGVWAATDVWGRAGGTRGHDGGQPECASREAGGRLPRRSAEEIGAVLDQIVGLFKKTSDGTRAEEIRAELGVQAKEMQRNRCSSKRTSASAMDDALSHA